MPYNVSLNTPFRYKSPQTPLFSLVIPPLDLVTFIYFMELNILKAIFSAIDTPKATKL
jgi:hypothetical protein